MSSLRGKVVMVTGASSGIGEATARAFAAEGCGLAIGARRAERIALLAAELRAAGGLVYAAPLDVTDRTSVSEFVQAAVQQLGRLDILVNTAGLARGSHQIAEAADDKLAAWREMLETNVLGLLNVTEQVVPLLLAQGSGHVISLGSVAGHGVYEGGSVYAASKHAELAISQTLRLEMLGKGIRVTSIDPGLVETEFSVVRYRGDEQRAKNVYAGLTPLTPADIAACIVWAASRPPHVNIDEMIVKPLDQAAIGKVNKRGA